MYVLDQAFLKIISFDKRKPYTYFFSLLQRCYCCTLYWISMDDITYTTGISSHLRVHSSTCIQHIYRPSSSTISPIMNKGTYIIFSSAAIYLVLVYKHTYIHDYVIYIKAITPHLHSSPLHLLSTPLHSSLHPSAQSYLSPTHSSLHSSA